MHGPLKVGVRTRAELIAQGYKPGKMANCSGCGAVIEWWTTPAGKAMPFSSPLKAEVIGLEPHWGTCPKAKELRKRTWNPPQRRIY